MMSQMASTNMEMMARPWLMYELTGSPAMLGVASLVQAVPMLALSLFGGVIADRVQKKKVIIISQIAAALVNLSIALTISLGAISVVYLLAAGFLNGVIFALMMPSRHAIVPEIVGEERLMNAVALNSAVMNTNRLLGPAAAGFIIATTGIGSLYYVMTGLYLLATIPLIFMPSTGTISVGSSSPMSQIKETMRYARKNTTVLFVLAFTFISFSLSMPYQQLLPVFTRDILGVGPGGLGMLMSITGIGALVGSLLVATLGNRSRGILFLHSLLILGLALVAFSFSPSYGLSLAMTIPLGLGQGGHMALSNVLVQTYTDADYRGRMMSLYFMQFGLASFGTFGVAVLAQFVGVQWAVGSTAMLLILIALYSYAFLPRLRRLD